MLPAIIIGNGRSRYGLGLKRFTEFGVTFGCNAIYRDFPQNNFPDYIVAIDDGIIHELVDSDYPAARMIFPPENERWEPAECNPNRPRSNAGMNAMIEAIKRGHKDLIMLGFDFLLLDKKQSVSNLYDGTSNYGPETRASAADNPNRVKYLAWLINKHPEVTFIFAYPNLEPTYNIKAPNLFFVTFEQIRDNIYNDRINPLE